MSRFVVSLLLGAGLLAHGQNVRHEGPYWQRFMVAHSARPSNKITRVEIFSSRAHVVVRGSSDGSFGVALSQQVRALSLDEANRAWGPMPVGPITPVGSILRLKWEPQGSGRVDTKFEVTVPYQVATVVVSNQSGSVEVYDVAGDVHADTSGGPLVLDRIGGDVRAVTGLGDVFLGSVGGSVQCSSGGGTIGLVSAAGEVNCHTGGGDIEVGSVGGTLVVSTEGGNIHVVRAGGTVRAKSMAGLVDVEEALGKVFADSSAGGVRVRGGAGPMTVSAMMGDILAELFGGGRFANSSLVAESGDITLVIPPGLGLVVRARNSSGSAARVVSDFPEISTRSVGFRAPETVSSSIQGGGPVLDLNTNGTVYLRKAK